MLCVFKVLTEISPISFHLSYFSRIYLKQLGAGSQPGCSTEPHNKSHTHTHTHACTHAHAQAHTHTQSRSP